jgi:hypothetical protein
MSEAIRRADSYISRNGGQEEDCTVMLAVGRASGDGRAVVAKNRDVETISSPEIVVLENHSGRNTYLGIATIADPSSLTLAMNDKGIIINTAGRYCLEPMNPGVNSGVIIRRSIERAGSAGELSALVQDIVTREGKSKNGSAFACADAHEAYIVETYQKQCEVMGPLKNTLFTYGNFMVTEKMKPYEKRPRGYQRAKRARELMEKHEGGVTIPSMIGVCRDHEKPPALSLLWDDYNVCTHGYGRDTRGSGICFADRRHPALLSVLWAALNLPCRTPYIPFYMGMTQVPADFATAKAYETFESLGAALEKVPEFKPQVRQYWEAFEFQTLRETGPLEIRARKLSDGGRQEEAAELLTNFVAARAIKALADAEKITKKVLRKSII